MRINLYDFIDTNESTKCLEKEIEFRKELNNLIASIIKGENVYYTKCENLAKRIGLKYKKEKEEEYNSFGLCFVKKTQYKIELNESNVEIIQEYIDCEVNDGEESN